MGICESKPINQAIDESKENPNLDKGTKIVPENQNGSNNIKELLIGHKPISIKVSIHVMKSICKIIIIKGQNNFSFGTGFFMKVSDSEKYLITNNHVISQDVINKFIIEIEIHNQKKIRLNFNNRKKKYFGQAKDITIIKKQ